MADTIHVAVGGYRGAGKDEFSDALVKSFNDIRNTRGGFPTRKTAFAEKIKRICVDVFGFTEEQMNDRVMKYVVDEFWGITPRRFMTLIGTDMFKRKFREDVWAMVVVRMIWNSPCERFIVSDLRYDDEAKACHRVGGVTVWVDRDCVKPPCIPAVILWFLRRLAMVFTSMFNLWPWLHSSEWGLRGESVDIHIDNNGTVEELRKRAFHLALSIFKAENGGGGIEAVVKEVMDNE